MSIQRFSVVVALLVLAWLVLPASTNSGADDDETKAGQKTSPLLMGPFSFGDFYTKVEAHEELAKFMGKERAPSEENIVKALQGCQFYVLDQSVMRANGTWGFHEHSDKFPRILVGGDLHCVVTNSGGQDVEIQLIKAETRDSHTEVFNHTSDSRRKLTFAMQCRVKLKAGPEWSWNMPGHQFAAIYDVNGKIVQSLRFMEK